ncbi:MAG: phospholipase C [Nitrososphaeraceae archaeon]
MPLFVLACNFVLPANSEESVKTSNFNYTSNSTTNSSIINTTTPIEHLIIIFQENVSFDHYFGTYPNAKNLDGEIPFYPSLDTPSVDGLTKSILYNNTNLSDPFRMNIDDAKIVASCGNNHTYTAIQKSYNSGFMNKFVEANGEIEEGCTPHLTMGYFDGNTVTALWNYAQNFAMSDNFHSTITGPSLPGHINLISGQTHGVIPENLDDNTSHGTLIGDADSLFDACSNGTKLYMTGKNIGDLLNKKEITWGWFSGGFKPTSNVTSDGKVVCGSSHVNILGKNVTDYVVHHEPFQYYESTANPFHLPPSSVEMIGHSDQANHQYDLSDFWAAVDNDNIPSVSFLKAPYYQTGHTKASDPVNEQKFLVDTINKLQNISNWNNTAIIIAYDDTGGWYDHRMPPIVMQSNDPKYDAIAGPGLCGIPDKDSYLDRCGYGGRVPFIIISPWAKVNYIDHQLTDQTSILRFIEDNWDLGRIGDNSFDEKAGQILNMFNFTKGHYAEKLFLNSTDGTIMNKE